MNKDIKITLNTIRQFESMGKSDQKQAGVVARKLIKSIQNGVFSPYFKGFSVNELAWSPHNNLHNYNVGLMFKSAKLLTNMIGRHADADDVFENYEGQIMTVHDARQIFAYYDSDPDCAENDRENVRFLDSTKDPYVVVNEGNAEAISWNDIDNAIDTFKHYLAEVAV